MQCDVMRCVAMAVDVTFVGRGGMDLGWDGIGWRWRLMPCDAMRCDAMAMDVTLIGRGGLDLGWIKWDVGLDLVIGRGRIGVEFGMKVFKYG